MTGTGQLDVAAMSSNYLSQGGILSGGFGPSEAQAGLVGSLEKLV
jgi:hypothetical protein